MGNLFEASETMQWYHLQQLSVQEEITKNMENIHTKANSGNV